LPIDAAAITLNDEAPEVDPLVAANAMGHPPFALKNVVDLAQAL
jgi:hypothetical protein